MGHMHEKKPIKIVVKHGEFAGKPMIYIHEVKKTIDGEQVDEKALLQFGTKKAEAILAAYDDIKKFVEG